MGMFPRMRDIFRCIQLSAFFLPTITLSVMGETWACCCYSMTSFNILEQLGWPWSPWPPDPNSRLHTASKRCLAWGVKGEAEGEGEVRLDIQRFRYVTGPTDKLHGVAPGVLCSELVGWLYVRPHAILWWPKQIPSGLQWYDRNGCIAKAAAWVVRS